MVKINPYGEEKLGPPYLPEVTDLLNSDKPWTLELHYMAEAFWELIAQRTATKLEHEHVILELEEGREDQVDELENKLACVINLVDHSKVED